MDAVKGFIGELPDGSTMFHDGREVFRAAKGNVADCRTGFLIGRFECSVKQWDGGHHKLFGLPTTQR